MRKPRITPRRWQPPPAPGMTGAFRPNAALANLQRIPVPGIGPEDVACAADGTLFTGVDGGAILARSPSADHWRQIAQTQGRPLGIEMATDGTLIICDAERGLLRVDPATGTVDVLVDTLDGRRLIVTNNASVAGDGTVYFSQSSDTYTLQHLKADFLEHGSHGRLLRYGTDGRTEVLLDGLDFANGVCLAADESFVLVAETTGYRVRRYWLTGPHAGTDEVLIDNLPGFPDNISLGTEGRFWIAMPSERNALLDRLLPRAGFLRKIVWALPDAIQPDASRITFVIAIDANGSVVANLQADGQAFHYVTGVREHDGALYLGSLMEPAIARVSLTA
jgi:sugar lactone lactonase YvrE